MHTVRITLLYTHIIIINKHENWILITLLVPFQSEYGGISDIRIPPSKLWTPDLLMYNSASTEFDTTYQVNCVVHSNGWINFIPPGIFISTCKVRLLFPNGQLTSHKMVPSSAISFCFSPENGPLNAPN